MKSGFSMIADYEGDLTELFDMNCDGVVPLLVTRNLVLFPGVVSPVVIGREASVKLVNALQREPDTIFAVACQRNHEVDNPTADDIYELGVYAKLLRVLELPNGSLTAIVQGMGRCRIVEVTNERPYFKAYATSLTDERVDESDEEYLSAIQDLKDETIEYIRKSADIPDEAQMAVQNIENPLLLQNYVCTSLPFSPAEKIDLLRETSNKMRVMGVLTILHRERQFLNIKNNIRKKTRKDIDDQQREFFLQQEIKNIRKELGEGESQDKKQLRIKGAGQLWPEEVAAVFERELGKLDHLSSQSPDYHILLTYLQTMVDLPWGILTCDDHNLARAEKVLDKDHYGMRNVKERILEHLAVLSFQYEHRAPILCLYGPPGVGKTSLGKSIATAMKRKYARISLGGLHDEAEIRGHRRTYIGAMPGRIIKNIQKVGTSNPVFILDEIDKVVTATHNGDPSSALLEVLDPEQNRAFHDNYLDVDFNLSAVLFIATANDVSSIPRPLLDRMEIIEVGGYITEEKVEIARRHLIPKERDNCGLGDEKRLTINKAAIEHIIERYTRESGVRQLEKQINKAFRKMAYMKAKNGELPYTKITPEVLPTLLGQPPYYRDIYQGNDYAGVVTGLAWTSVGGEILFIETSLSRGKGSKLTLTGNLGEVMKESAVLALEYIKAHADVLGIDSRVFDNWNIHIHVPQGATPKDGPSAGITIATSIASALTQRKVRKATAMTGEITLRGKVLPVGGIKEKILAAKRAGIKDILLCHANRKDIEEIDEEYRSGVEFHYVENVQDVWAFALTNELVDNPKSLDIDAKAADTDAPQQ